MLGCGLPPSADVDGEGVCAALLTKAASATANAMTANSGRLLIGVYFFIFFVFCFATLLTVPRHVGGLAAGKLLELCPAHHVGRRPTARWRQGESGPLMNHDGPIG
jgi:hypothetical protein